MPSELLPGENLILKDHQHWIVVVKSLLFPVALLILVALIDIFFHTDSFRRDKKIVVTLIVVAIAGLCLIRASSATRCSCSRSGVVAAHPALRRPRIRAASRDAETPLSPRTQRMR